MNVDQLNQLLAGYAQGTTARVSQKTITSTMRGCLFVPIEVPINVDVEFENVIFDGEHYFQQRKNGRLIFRNCVFRGLRTVFTRCLGGSIRFLDKIDLGFGFTFENCEEGSLHIDGSLVSFQTHPEWDTPVAVVNNNVMNLSVRKSVMGAIVKNVSSPLVFQAWDSVFTNLEVDGDKLNLFELLKTKVEHLSLSWRELGTWRNKDSFIDRLNVDFEKLLAAPLAERPTIIAQGMDSSSLTEIASCYRRQGEMKKFVEVISLAGTAAQLVQRGSLLDERRAALGKGHPNWPKRIGINARYYSKWLSSHVEDIVINFWFKRFYSVWPVLLLQIAVVFAFAAIYCALKGNLTISPDGHIDSFGQALYFSGATFLTIGYGDIAPSGVLQLIAILEGFCGLILSLLLAVVASRRYSA